MSSSQLRSRWRRLSPVLTAAAFAARMNFAMALGGAVLVGALLGGVMTSVDSILNGGVSW